MVLDCSYPQRQRRRIKSSLRKEFGTEMVLCLHHLSSLIFGIYNLCTPRKKRAWSHLLLTQFVLFLQLDLIWVSLSIFPSCSAGLLGFLFLLFITVLWYLANFTTYTWFPLCHLFNCTTSFPLLLFSYILFIHLCLTVSQNTCCWLCN